jgi:hypothetical protein
MVLRNLFLGIAATALLANTSWGAVRHLYTFNDGTANDSVGTAHGTLVDGATAATGQLILGGGTQHASLPGPTIAINTYTELTVETWLTASVANTGFTMSSVFGRTFEGTENNWEGFQYLMIQPSRNDGNARVAIAAGSCCTAPTESGINRPGNLNDGMQHHIGVTVNATDLAFYLDGALVGTTPLGANTLNTLSNNLAYLGRSVYQFDPNFIGTINEFRIHDNAFTAAQMSASVAAGPAGLAGPTLEINRDTGAMKLTNQGTPLQIFSYSVDSPSGALNPANWTTVTGHFDAPPSGNGSFDANDAWTVVNSTNVQISEEEPLDGGADDGGSLGNVTFSAGGAWIKSFREDVTITTQALIGGVPTTFTPAVKYVGNGGQAFKRSDLNFDNAINAADWILFRTNSKTTIAGTLSDAQSYALGDLDGNQTNDFYDFRLFQQDFDAANGAGAFAATIGAVPEPSTAILTLMAAAGLARSRRSTRRS